MSEIVERDKRGNIIYRRDADGLESWHTYDENEREIYYRDTFGYELWYTYENGKLLVHRTNPEAR